MQETIKLMSALLLLGIMSVVSAQVDFNSSELDAAARVKHEKSSSLPEGIAFRATIRTVYSIYEEDSAMALEYVRQKTGLSAADAQDFVNHAVITYDAILSENRQITT